MLSAKELVEHREKPVPQLPSFGIKEFEPDESPQESYQIQASLSKIDNIISYERVKVLGSLSQAIWHPELCLAEVVCQTGSHWSTMGHTINQKLFIYPEEALYLLETGNLEIFFYEVSLSVERAYFILLGPESGINVEKYRVYSHLNALGYKVLRHSEENTLSRYEKQINLHKSGVKLKTYSKIKREKRTKDFQVHLEKNKKQKCDEKLNFPITNVESNDMKKIFENMQVIEPYVDYNQTSLNFDYDVYLEVFKKNSLQLPSYRIIIHSSEDLLPDLTELCRLSKKYCDEVPVIHAIVFPDYIAFYKINPVVLPTIFD